MTDYLKKLDDMIDNEQKAYFEKKRYCEGYLDALATIRYAVRGMLEEREKGSEAQDVSKGYYCIGSRSTGEVVVIPYGENTPKRHLKDVRATKREAISAYIFDTLVLLDSARKLLAEEKKKQGE